jgi:hypothetical protein
MLDNSNALEAARVTANRTLGTVMELPSPINPAPPGDDADSLRQTNYTQHHPELPPETAGADATATVNTIYRKHQRNYPASAGAGGQGHGGSQNERAPRDETTGRDMLADQRGNAGDGAAPCAGSTPFDASAAPKKSRRKAGQQVGPDHSVADAQLGGERPDLRWNDPTVAEIVQLHRMRRRWLKARNALILQGKAFGRSVCDGDKDAGTAAYDRVMTGRATPADDDLTLALIPFGAAIAHFETSIKPIERRLEKLAKMLPIAPFVEATRGLGWGSVATIVGEAGDLSKYPSIAGVWKRMGLAVIDGDGRQRKCADAERALIHGYNPERRSVVWNAGNNVVGGMGNGKRPLAGENIDAREDWTAYERLFVARLRHEAARDTAMRLPDTKEGKESYTKHAAARAKRYVEKRLLRDMTAAWRAAVGQELHATPSIGADRHQTPEASGHVDQDAQCAEAGSFGAAGVAA